jgi:hypothetical protein
MAATPILSSSPTTRAPLDVNIHDTSIGIWQDDARDPTFQSDIYGGLIRLLRDRGWRIREDPEIRRRYPSLSETHRLAARGTLRASIEVSGRVVNITFWGTTWPIANRNGRRFDFDKRRRLTFLDRLRVDLETAKILAWLGGRAPLTTKNRNDGSIGLGRGKVTAEAWIARQYAECWHTDKALGRPVCQSCNARSADRNTVEHGATVWFIDRKGRIGKGVAHYRLNSQWMIAVNRHDVRHVSAHEIFVEQPPELRRKRNERARRSRLEGELAKAIRAMDFLRADRLKRILFGAETSYGIWNREKGAFYRANHSGYTTDSISAGRYTWAEATREVARVPHLLSLVMPDGRHLTHEQLTKQAAGRGAFAPAEAA